MLRVGPSAGELNLDYCVFDGVILSLELKTSPRINAIGELVASDVEETGDYWRNKGGYDCGSVAFEPSLGNVGLDKRLLAG